MARFPKGVSSAAASAHAAYMREVKKGGGGCAVLPFTIIAIMMVVRFVA